MPSAKASTVGSKDWARDVRFWERVSAANVEGASVERRLCCEADKREEFMGDFDEDEALAVVG
jgi:hypothetical protein